MSVKLMDCTLRDGGNVVGKGFNAEITEIVLDCLTACHVPIIEFGNAGGIGAYEVAGFTKADANPDIGDSAITETGGLGGFAIAAAPAIVQFVGGTAADALRYSLSMYEITDDESRMYQIPALDFRGTPTGIDVRKVVEKNMVPVIDTGVAHKKAGIGQVGAGIVSAPMGPFQKAYDALAQALK